MPTEGPPFSKDQIPNSEGVTPEPESGPASTPEPEIVSEPAPESAEALSKVNADKSVEAESTLPVVGVLDQAASFLKQIAEASAKQNFSDLPVLKLSQDLVDAYLALKNEGKEPDVYEQAELLIDLIHIRKMLAAASDINCSKAQLRLLRLTDLLSPVAYEKAKEAGLDRLDPGATQETATIDAVVDNVEPLKPKQFTPEHTPSVKEINVQELEEVLSELKDVFTDAVLKKSQDLFNKVLELYNSQGYSDFDLLKAKTLLNQYSQNCEEYSLLVTDEQKQKIVYLKENKSSLSLALGIREGIVVASSIDQLYDRYLELKKLFADSEFYLWVLKTLLNPTLSQTRTASYLNVIKSLSPDALKKISSADKRNELRTYVLDGIKSLYNDLGADTERKQQFVEGKFLTEARLILSDLDELDAREKSLALKEQEKQEFKEKFVKWYEEFKNQCRVLASKVLVSTPENNAVKNEYANLNEQLNQARERFGFLPEFNLVILALRSSEIRSSLRSLLTGITGLENDNVGISELGVWKAGVFNVLQQDAANKIIEIYHLKQKIDGDGLTAPSEFDPKNLEKEYRIVEQNVYVRMDVHLSWASSQSALEGDGKVVVPPSGLRDSIFPLDGSHVTYLIKGGRDRLSSEALQFYFNPVVGIKDYKIPNFFANRRDQGEFLTGSYEMTLIDFMLQILDEVYRGDREDAIYKGEKISFMNFHVSRGALWEYLVKEAKKKILDTLSTDPRIDPKIARFVNTNDPQFELAQEELKTAAKLAYKISLMAFCNHSYMARGSNAGQGAKIYYDMDPRYFFTYVDSGKMQAHPMQFLGLWGFPGVTDFFEEYLTAVASGHSKVGAEVNLLQKLSPSKASPETLRQRYAEYGSTSYKWLLQPVIVINNVERGYERNNRNERFPVKEKFALAPNPVRQQPIKVDPSKVSDTSIPITEMYAQPSDEGAKALRFETDPVKIYQPKSPENNGNIVTNDDIQDEDGTRLYGLMATEQFPNFLNFWNNWANNFRPFMDAYVFTSMEGFLKAMDSIGELAGYKKQTSYITVNMPVVAAEVVNKTIFANPETNGNYKFEYPDVIRNRIIVKLVFIKCLLEFIVNTQSRGYIDKYLDNALKAGILGNGTIAIETRDAIAQIIFAASGAKQQVRQIFKTLSSEMEKWAQYH